MERQDGSVGKRHMTPSLRTCVWSLGSRRNREEQIPQLVLKFPFSLQHRHTHIYTHMSICVCLYMYMYLCVHMHLCIYVYMSACAPVCSLRDELKGQKKIKQTILMNWKTMYLSNILRAYKMTQQAKVLAAPAWHPESAPWIHVKVDEKKLYEVVFWYPCMCHDLCIFTLIHTYYIP